MTTTDTHLHATIWAAAGGVASAAARRLPTERLLVPGPTVGPEAAPAPSDPEVLRASLGGDVEGTVHLLLAPGVAAALSAGDAATEAFADVAAALETALGLTVEVGPAAWTDALDADATTIAVPLFDADELVATLLLTVSRDVTHARGEVAASPEVTAAPGARRGLGLLHQVEMGVTVELGRTQLTVRELLGLAPGSVVELDRTAGAPVDVLVNGTLIARGEVVVVDEEFAVRISEIVAGPSSATFS